MPGPIPAAIQGAVSLTMCAWDSSRRPPDADGQLMEFTPPGQVPAHTRTWRERLADTLPTSWAVSIGLGLGLDDQPLGLQCLFPCYDGNGRLVRRNTDWMVLGYPLLVIILGHKEE